MSEAAGGHPRELLSAYRDDELGVEERGVIDRHLAGCEDCRAELAALERLARAIADEAIPPVPVDLVARIGRRIDAATVVRRRRFRFAIPATIAATIAALGILVTLQWREGRLAVPQPRSETKTETKTEPETKNRIQEQAPSPAANAPPALHRVATPDQPALKQKSKDEDRSKPTELLEKESDSRVVKDELRRNVAPATAGAVEAEAPAAASAPVPAERERAAKAAVVSSCADRWSDSGAQGRFVVDDPARAARELDRTAVDVGGVAVWRGAADGRPYQLIVPRRRYEEVFHMLRGRGVTGLREPTALAPGDDCVALSIALVPSGRGAGPPR